MTDRVHHPVEPLTIRLTVAGDLVYGASSPIDLLPMLLRALKGAELREQVFTALLLDFQRSGPSWMSHPAVRINEHGCMRFK